MTKVITSPDIDFGVVDEFKSSVVNSKITNTGTERVTLTNLVSSDERFVLNSFDTRIEPKMPANSTLYFGANGRIQSATGAYYTTNQGLGSIGTTDSDGKLTVNYLMPSLALTAPSAGTKYKLSESFNVTWTSSNITLVNIILESESGGYKKYSDVDATLGTLAVAISASDGFSINETVYIYIENTHQTVDDSVQVQSIATVTINSPTLTAGTEGNVTGTSNGVEVDVYYRVSSPEGAWQVFKEGVAVSGGNWSATGTIADADTYDFKVEDTTDRDGSAQVDDVEVASGSIERPYLFMGTTELRLAETINDATPELIDTTLLDGNPHTAVWDGVNIYLSNKTSSTVVTVYKKDKANNTISSVEIPSNANQSFASLYERGEYIYLLTSTGSGLQEAHINIITKADMSYVRTNLRYLLPANTAPLARANVAGVLARGTTGYVMSCDDFSSSKHGAVFLNEARNATTKLTATFTHDSPVNVAWLDDAEEYWVYVPSSGTIYRYDVDGAYIGTTSTTTQFAYGANILIQNGASVREFKSDGITSHTVNTTAWVNNGLSKAWEEE